ncbi:hypothetical protein Tco_0760916 [Tanacetum coccineum]
MDELLRIPFLGIESAIVIPAVLADEFEIKPTLIDFVNNNPFYGFEEEDPHSHIRRFYQITRTLRLNQVPDDVTFTEAWERFNDLLRECPHHGFSLLHQINFFYSGLSQSDQDFLNTTTGGNLITKNTQEALIIIERKARVRSYKNKYVQEEQGVQKEQEKQAAQSFTPYWNFPMIDDDDEYTIQYREYLENSSKEIVRINVFLT